MKFSETLHEKLISKPTVVPEEVQSPALSTLQKDKLPSDPTISSCETSTTVSDSEAPIPSSESVFSMALVKQSTYIGDSSSPNSGESPILSPRNLDGSAAAIAPVSTESVSGDDGSVVRYRMPYSSSDRPYSEYGGQRVYECTICHWKFKIRQHLTRHMLSHTDEKRFKCEVCGKSFNRKSNMKNHRKIHAGYTCDRCHEHFASLKDYRAHEEEEKCPKLSEKQSTAAVCASTTNDTSKDVSLSAKKPAGKSATDSKSQIFRCSICNTMYGYQAGLKRHMRQKHSQGVVAVKPKHTCPICGKVFERPYRLYVHFNKLHRTAFAEPAVRKAIQDLEPLVRDTPGMQNFEVKSLLDGNDNVTGDMYALDTKSEEDAHAGPKDYHIKECSE